MSVALPEPTANQAYRAGALALVVALAAIVGALGFEHIGGLLPCPLCLEQRYAYYAGIPLLFVALVAVSADQRRLAAFLFLVVALAFLGNAGLSAYHAGVEWHFWPGPASCTGAQELTTSAGGLLQALETTNVVRCDEAAWRFAGISLAGWNVIASLIVCGLSAHAGSESLQGK